MRGTQVGETAILLGLRTMFYPEKDPEVGDSIYGNCVKVLSAKTYDSAEASCCSLGGRLARIRVLYYIVAYYYHLKYNDNLGEP